MNGTANMQAQTHQPQYNISPHFLHALRQQAEQAVQHQYANMTSAAKQQMFDNWTAQAPVGYRDAVVAKHGTQALNWLLCNNEYKVRVNRYIQNIAQGQNGPAQTEATTAPPSQRTPHVQTNALWGQASHAPLVGMQQAFTQTSLTQTQGQISHTPSPATTAPTNSTPTQQPFSLPHSVYDARLHAQQSFQARPGAVSGAIAAPNSTPQSSHTLNIIASQHELHSRRMLSRGLRNGPAAHGNLCAQHKIVVGGQQMQKKFAPQEKLIETFTKYTAFFPVCSTCRTQEVKNAIQNTPGPSKMPPNGSIDTCSCASHIMADCPFCEVGGIETKKRLAMQQRQGHASDSTPRMRCHCGKPAEYEEAVRKCAGCGGISTQPANFAGERVKFYAATDVVASVGDGQNVVMKYVQQLPYQVQQSQKQAQAASSSSMAPMQNTPTMTPGHGTFQPSNKRKLDHDYDQTQERAPKRQLQYPMPRQPTPQHDHSQSMQTLQRNTQLGNQSAGLSLPKQLPTPQLRTNHASSPAAYSPQAGSSQVDSPATPAKKKRAPREEKRTASQAGLVAPVGNNYPQRRQTMPPNHQPLYDADIASRLASTLGLIVKPHTIEMGQHATPFHVMATLLVDNHYNHIDHSTWLSALKVLGLNGVEMAYPQPQKGSQPLSGGLIMDNLRNLGFMHNHQARTRPGVDCGCCARQHALMQGVVPSGRVSTPPAQFSDPNMPSPESAQGRKTSGQRAKTTTSSQENEIIDLSSPASSPNVATPEQARAAEPGVQDNTGLTDEDWMSFVNYPDNATAEPGSDGSYEQEQQPLVEDTIAGHGAKNSERSLTQIEANLLELLQADRPAQEQSVATSTTQQPTVPAGRDESWAGYYPVGHRNLSNGVNDRLFEGLEGEALLAVVREESFGSGPPAVQETESAVIPQAVEIAKETGDTVACELANPIATADGAADSAASATNTTASDPPSSGHDTIPPSVHSTPPTLAGNEQTSEVEAEKQHDTTPPISTPAPDFLPRVLTPEEQAQADSIGTIFDLGEDEPSFTQEGNGGDEWAVWPPEEDGTAPAEEGGEDELPERPEGLMSAGQWEEVMGSGAFDDLGSQFE
ncbi:hypothetical protein LTR78_003002 [Recurvomyces mirabilis]|uniref:Uncharacterized protein n=1 Tax=Recurvomyces mirabilis TaxID=574656 RepID=A0AAE0WSV6_9PEZI|nr:hypothetical protein LTR78_003002 [Recurvomyces mirabilis]KAK5159267.1 hypothetical protein LTS14_002409 [Recurvomyces mirabilis]